MEVLKKGTIESLLVPLRDRLGNLTDLTTVSGKTFTTRKKSDDSAIQTAVPWTVDPDFPMTAICTIDTTLAGYTADDEFKLYISYIDGAEHPYKGPVYFRVDDD